MGYLPYLLAYLDLFQEAFLLLPFHPLMVNYLSQYHYVGYLKPMCHHHLCYQTYYSFLLLVNLLQNFQASYWVQSHRA